MSEGRVTVGHPVDVGSGAVFSLSTDFRLPGSLELPWRRYYSTVAACNSWLGVKWTVPYHISLERRAEGYVLCGAHGEEVTFAASPEPLRIGAILTNFGAHMELCRETHHYHVLHWHSGGDINRFYFPAKDDERLPLSWIDNLAGHRIRIEYDAAGRLSRLVQELERRTVEITYNREALIDAIYFLGTTGRKLLIGYEYDKTRRLVTAVDGMGHRKGYAYDRENRLIAETNPLGSRFVFEYDRKGRCTRTAGADGFMERKLRYLTAPLMTRVTDSRGAVTEYFLNQSGQVVQIVDSVGGVTTNTFDEQGRLLGVIHPDGAKESSSYDDNGNRVATMDPCGAKTVVEFDELHVPIRLVDGNGNTWKLPSPREGSLTGVENLPRRLWKYHWGARGLVTQADCPGGWVFQIRRGENLRWQENHDQISLVTRTEYDEFGNATQVGDADGVVSQTRYDDLNRPLEITRGTSESTRFKWNGIGRMTERIRPGCPRESWAYDHYGYLIAQTDSMGGIANYEYDQEGKLAAITNRAGERLEYHRDSLGRIIEEKLFDGRIQRYEYDPCGRRVKICLSDGRTVGQRFDAAGRIVRRQASDGLLEEFAYDNEGRVVKAWNSHSVVELKRDRFARIIAEIQNGRRVQFRYDADGNRTGRSLPFTVAGCKLTRAFDARGRLLEIWDERGPCQEFRWDNIDRLVERRCPGGVIEHFTYDSRRRLHKHRLLARDGHFTRLHFYDPRGNLAILEDDRDGRVHFTYDSLDRLKKAEKERSAGLVAEAYDYDANHAMRASHRGLRRVGPGGKVLQDGLRDVSYGDDGTVATIRSSPSAWRLKHDVNGRLVEVTQPHGTAIHYEYDPFGRRTAKIIGEERTDFLWEGWALAAEVRDKAVQNVYLSANLRPLGQWKSGRRFTLILDGRGAVQNVFDEYGEMRWSCNLDAYGNVISEQGDMPSPFRLRGQYHDTETGLYYNFHRHYDPGIGDYTAPDPIGVAGGYHFYAYPRNPLRWDDPFGLECGDPDQHKDDPPKEDPNSSKPQTGPAALADPPEEPPVTPLEEPSIPEIAQKIADGHAWDEHVLEDGHFPDVEDKADFAAHLENAMLNADEIKELPNDRTAYWHDETETLVIHDPNDPDMGTAFQPDRGKDYFDDL